MASASSSPALRSRRKDLNPEIEIKSDKGLTLNAVFDVEYDWTLDDLADVIHWMRQIMGLLCGLVWGISPFLGAFWFFLFLGIVIAIPYWYYNNFLGVDPEEIGGGHQGLFLEGLASSVGLFMLAWVLTYNVVHV